MLEITVPLKLIPVAKIILANFVNNCDLSLLTESLSSAQKIRNLYKLMSGDISVSQIPFKFQVCSRARTITATRLVVPQTLKVIPVRTQASATTPYLMKEVSIKPEYQEGQTKKGPQATGVKILDNRKVSLVILLQSPKSFCRKGPSTLHGESGTFLQRR